MARPRNIVQDEINRIKYIEDRKRVKAELILTWQPVAAIAFRANITVRRCLNILVELYNDGEVKCSKARIDGHNLVWLFKKIEYVKVMGMNVPVDTRSQEMDDA
jgi:hypothetical protein